MRNLVKLGFLLPIFLLTSGNAVCAFSNVFNNELDRYSRLEECSGARTAWMDCKSTIIVDENSVYSGAIFNGKQHGYGVLNNLNNEITTTGLWYKGKIIFAHKKLLDGEVFSGVSMQGTMFGFSEMRHSRYKSKSFLYGHVVDKTSFGNIVSELREAKNVDSAFIGPGEGLRPHGVGFVYYRDIGFQWCGLNVSELPCANQPTTKTAISSIRHSFNSLQIDERKKIQRELNSLLYYNSLIDGKWGQNTQYALLKYLALHTSVELTPYTKISAKQLVSLLGHDKAKPIPYGSIERLVQNGFSSNIQTSGTGFLFSNAGHILTNEHVVSDCSKITFTVDSETAEVNLTASNPSLDIAILTSNIEPKSLLKFREQNISPNLMEEVYAVGYPYGEELANNITVTSGIISSETFGPSDQRRFQFDAAIQPGNSGGPVLDKQGHLLGIVTAKANFKYFLKKYGSIPEGISFAIDLESVNLFLAEHGLFLNKDKKSKLEKPNLKKVVGIITCSQNLTIDSTEIYNARFEQFSQ